ncbi:MAG: FAD-dependent oxidoreductase [Chloroflexi bacterium]|nr:FAD-dependent oxidoreductase [Chloroflexota bacterium]
MTDATFDLVVVGSGAAGLSAALRAADLGARVGVLTAGPLLAGSSPRAQGGVAAAIGADDTPAIHAEDTLLVGAGLNDAGAVDVLTRDGTRSVRRLRAAGVPFADDLGLEAGHARRRILHAGGGATGQVLTTALLSRAQEHRCITLLDHSPVTALTLSDRRVLGVEVSSSNGLTPHVNARAVILATGGYAALWSRTTNAPETRGSGLALAYTAGATLADLEFVQFHPTALSLENAPALLLSEALRGEGARLIDDDGREVVNPLLPRDVLARSLYRELSQGRKVFLSLGHLDPDHVYAHFSALAAKVRDTAGLDLARDRLPVAPAAHYCMGGIRTDTWGRTDVPGLYAAGETACSGVQGANRLASNSLLECLVFGARTAEAALNDPPDAAAHWQTHALPTVQPGVAQPGGTRRVIDPSRLGTSLDRDVGVQRDGPHLERLAQALPAPEPTSRADLLVASLITRAAWLRRESRGAHFRTDYPLPDPAWRGRIHWRLGQAPVFEEVCA